MQKLILCFFALAIIIACNPSSSKPQGKSVVAGNIPDAPGPDGSDLLLILQGRWESIDDPAYSLEIIDTQMRHLRQGQLSLESDLEIDGSCLRDVCKMDSTNLQDGWCFIEKNKSGAQCYLVSSCDKTNLQYNKIGDENAIFRFKKTQ